MKHKTPQPGAPHEEVREEPEAAPDQSTYKVVVQCAECEKHVELKQVDGKYVLLCGKCGGNCICLEPLDATRLKPPDSPHDEDGELVEIYEIRGVIS